ncbi:MAG: type II secretion system F family protein [Candidatus Falkowbacteria bacterium]
MLKENNKKKTIRRLTKVCLFVLLLAGSFLFGANSRAANNDYNKIATSTLTAVEWNNLINDFVNTWKSDSMVGPLGIGTTNPLYSLDVNGTGSFNQPLIVGTPTASNHAATKNYVDSIIGGGSGSTVGYWTMNGININNSNAGNVGIGTASPASKLDVVGNAAISGTLTVPTINGLSISNFYGPNNAITWNVTAPASYTNNNVVAPDFTTTAATLNFTAGNGSHWDLYNAMSGLTPGASYTVSLYVKLGTSTNFSLVVNNAAAWNTIGGRVFTAADGLSTSAWKQISYTFTEPVGKTTANIHIGANQETALTGTPQVVGSVYVWGFQVVQNNAGTLALQPTVGNVGIGVSAPGSKLSIRGASGSNALEIQRASDGASMITVDDWGQLNASHGFMISAGGGYSGNSVLDVRSSSAGHIPFSVLGYSGQTGNLVNITSNGGTQGNLFNIQANGNVGIGTTNPLAPLAIVTPSSGNYEAIRINRDATGATYWSLGSVYNNTNPDLIFKVNGGEKIRFDVNGNVGIGTTSPLFKLDVNGTGSFNQPVVVGTPTIASHAATKNYVDSAIGGGSGSTVGYWAMNGTNINNSNAGNVGVGTTTPGFKLDVNGNARFTDIYNSGTVLKKSPYEYYGSVYLSNTLDSTNNTAYVNIGTFQDGFTHINVEVELVPWLFSTGNIGSYQKSYTIRMTAASPGIVNVYDSRVIKDVGQTGDRYQIGTPEADANNLLRIPIKYIGAGGGNQIQAFVRVTGTMSGNIDDVSLSAVAATPVSAGTQEYMSFRNRLGIGITNPLGTLHVSNASSTNALVVSSGGQIGVGIATPQSIGTNYGTIDVRGPSGGGFFFGPSAGPSGLFYSNGSQLYMGSYTNIPLNLQTNNLVRATIDGGGNVGIGTTSPLYKLDVNGTGSFNQPVIVGTPTIASHAATKNYVDSALSGGSGSTVGYWVMNGTNINNSNAGNVGIGTTNPGGVLQVTGTENSRVILSQSTFDYAKKSPKLSFFAYGDNGLITGPSIQKTSTGSYGAGNLGFIQHPTGDYTTEVEVMTITPTGNVGIGTTLPNGKLDIRDANNAAIYLSSSAADATSATSKIYSGYGGSGGWANTYLRFATSPASGTFNDSMTILGNGNIGVGTTNPLQLLDVRSANATAPIIAAGSTLSSYSANSVVSTISLGSYYTTGLQFYSAGQISGKLDEVLNYLADEMEKSYDMASKVKGAMIYPIFILVGLIGVAIVLMVYVIPNLTSVLTESGAELPFATRVVIGTSNFLTKYLLLLFLACVGLAFLARLYLKTYNGQRNLDIVKLRMPIFGTLFKYIYLMRFTRSLSTLLKGGVTITKSLEIVADVVSNVIYKEIILATLESINDGNPLSTVMENEPTIPKMVPQMLAVGERTGKIDVVLDKITEFYSREADKMLANLSTLMEPVIMTVMGIGVGIMVAAVIMPMYNMASQF